MSSLRARFIQAIGTRAFMRVYTYGEDDRNAGVPCSSGRGHDSALKHVADTESAAEADTVGGTPDAYSESQWTELMRCERCGCDMGQFAHAKRQILRKRLYASGDWRGLPQPGDLYFADWYRCDERGGKCIHGWTNCDGRHLIATLPNGEWWDIDGRASNCTLPKDTEHRCWVRHGNPAKEAVHVDKAGRTCAAGAGSIISGHYHGFLHRGAFTSC